MKPKKILLFLMLIVITLTIPTSCNGQKAAKNNNKDKTMKQLPENALCMLDENKDNPTYLTAVWLLSEYEQKYVTFFGDGDYFLSYDTESKFTDTKNNIHVRTERNTLHVIPEANDRFRLEVRMNSSTFYENGENMGHAEPSGEWIFVGYSNDKDCEAARVLKYYKEHQRR